jgi:DNA-binding LacI/PurR family transcriptional regulator
MPPVPARRARLDDVAREAGVHVSTVSRVLNGTGGVSIRDETRERILDTARRLQYRPNAMARGLKLAATGTLGMLVPSLRNPVYSAIIRGAFDRAWERGYVVVLAEDTGQGETHSAYERLVAERRIDGLLIASARPGNPLIERLGDDSVPFVFVNRRQPGSGRNVSMREEEAGRIAAEHLLSLGHERLAHVAGPVELDTARRRAEGFAEAVRAAGHAVSVDHAAFDEREAHAVAAAVVTASPRPTAIFASNINQTVGTLAALRDAGLGVPADVSLVGYDDDSFLDFLDVPVTAVRMPLAELGATAVDELSRQLAGESARDVEIATAPQLVVRRSTAGPPS